MKDLLARYTMRINRNLLDKFGFIADYNGRTKNRELEHMIKARIENFEKKNGKIYQKEDGTWTCD